jgi:hypothetical protein
VSDFDLKLSTLRDKDVPNAINLSNISKFSKKVMKNNLEKGNSSPSLSTPRAI